MRPVVTLPKKLVAAEEIIREMAITDDLTKRKNRRCLLAPLREELDRATRYRQPDILGRYGGKEFLLILPETDLEQTGALAERLRQAIESQKADRNRVGIAA